MDQFLLYVFFWVSKRF